MEHSEFEIVLERDLCTKQGCITSWKRFLPHEVSLEVRTTVADGDQVGCREPIIISGVISSKPKNFNSIISASASANLAVS